MIIRKCDRCGKIIDNYVTDLAIHGYKYYIKGNLFWKSVTEDYVDEDFELCEECSKELIKWLGKAE